MWVFLNDAFLSIVQPGRLDLSRAGLRGADEGDYLCVRARVRNDLQRAFLSPSLKVHEWPGRDYPFRAFVLRETVANMLSTRVITLDATNFKDSVQEHERHDAYMDVWTVMNRFGRWISRTKRSRKNERFDGLGPSAYRE